MSEPQSSGALAVEMAGLDVIPESDRKGKPSDLFMPWFAANISVLGISWGSWVLGFDSPSRRPSSCPSWA